MWFTSRSQNRQSSMSGQRRGAHGFPRNWLAFWRAVAVLGLLGSFATPAARAALFGKPIPITVPQPVVAIATGDVSPRSTGRAPVSTCSSTPRRPGTRGKSDRARARIALHDSRVRRVRQR